MEKIKYNPYPCDRCKELTVRVEEDDEYDGSGIYYEITCDSCKYSYKVDGSDS
jgi:hypothetical protein